VRTLKNYAPIQIWWGRSLRGPNADAKMVLRKMVLSKWYWPEAFRKALTYIPAIMVFFTQLGGSVVQCLQAIVCLQVSRAISISLGQTILLNGLLREVPKVTQAVSAQSVVNTGATNLTSLTSDPHTLLAIRVAYSVAIRDVIFFTAGTIAIALPFALGMEWINLKKFSKSSGIEDTGSAEAITQ
jgi:hypothetical protein